MTHSNSRCHSEVPFPSANAQAIRCDDPSSVISETGLVGKHVGAGL